MAFFGLIQSITIAVSIAVVVVGGKESWIVAVPLPGTNFHFPAALIFVAGILLYFVSAALHGELIHICATFFQYFFMMPVFINVLSIYSFCNLQDLSWGTKGRCACACARKCRLCVCVWVV